jgi:nitronate monooxygenase
MALDGHLRARLTLPAICAPMFLVSGPELVAAACKAGIVGALPRQNARSADVFEEWLRSIREGIEQHLGANPGARIGPLAVNMATDLDDDQLDVNMKICERYGVEIVISAVGNPTRLVQRVHDWGGIVFHDVTTFKHADKAIEAGVDGLNCIGAGGGGHSGTVSHLVLIPRIRSMFDGVIVMAGAVSNGAAIRAAEVLGADLSYLGTRFIATQESRGRDEYKAMLVRGSSAELLYTADIAGVAANWMTESMAAVGLDPTDLPKPPRGRMSYSHLPEGVKPWKNVWSAGQGIDLIDDLPSVHELVLRLRREYVDACAIPDMVAAAELPDDVVRA